jgi:ring-1,2-phenylacetyl-CoA epoxidase subunit PaaB
MPKNSADVPPPWRRRKSNPRSTTPMNTPMQDNRHWPLYEVFVRARAGLDHKHVGSLHAADATMAIEHARDLYTRRQEGISIWVVPSKDITASDPAETDSLFEPARDKIYRHPTFYEIPDEVKTL